MDGGLYMAIHGRGSNDVRAGTGMVTSAGFACALGKKIPQAVSSCFRLPCSLPGLPVFSLAGHERVPTITAPCAIPYLDKTRLNFHLKLVVMQ